MAIYSKYPQIKKKTVSIKGERMNNTCIYSDMIINEDTIRVYNIHLASNWFKNTDYSFIQNPQSFITTVGLYNNENELLALAKLSKPLLKNFERETTIRVKLDY